MAGFCSNCGAAVAGGAFCGSCGARIGQAAPAAPPAPQPSSQTPTPVATASPVPVGAPQQGSGSNFIVKILFIVLGLIVLFGMIGMGSCIYLGYRAKKKADEIKEAYKHNDLEKLAGALGANTGSGESGSGSSGSGSAGSGSSAGEKPALSFPALNNSSAQGELSKVPLQKGLTVVTAVAQFGGDYESIKQIESVTSTAVSMSYRADNVPNPLGNLGQPQGAPKSSGSTAAHRTIRVEDLQSAHDYMELFGENSPDVYPGTTAIQVSQAVLSDLKTKGETSFTYRAGGLKGALGGLLGGLGALANGGNAGGSGSKEMDDLQNMGKVSCTLKRVNDGLHAFPVLLNDHPVTVPALHAQCSNDDGVADFYFLDNSDNPLALAWKLGDSGDTLQVVKISYPKQPPANAGAGNGPPAGGGAGGGAGAGGGGGGQQIEQELKQTGQAEVYGIYFDFASDKIKPESEAVLREIADALKHNPTWKLRVEGHTDNVGGDDYNMDLSQRRAEAVKQALVSRYHIAAERLTPQGFGASRPKESNDTLYGRARNRRVELVRE
jgi:outer membrane protein OmpA-like peptidoglycan-associated protein